MKFMITSIAAVFSVALFAAEPVAVWSGNLSDNAENNGFSLSLDSRNATAANGVVNLTSQTSGTGSTGITVQFPDDANTKHFSGRNLSVLVKYSGLNQSSFGGSHYALVSTKWKSKTDETLFAALGSYIKTAYGVNASSAGTVQNQTSCTIPENGLMLVTFSGNGDNNSKGAYIAFASRKNDGTYENFNQVLRAPSVTYTGGDFNDVKIGGTIAPTSKYYRPAMTVEGIALFKDLVTAANFDYEFPDDNRIVGTELTATKGWIAKQKQTVNVATDENEVTIDGDTTKVVANAAVYQVKAKMRFDAITPLNELSDPTSEQDALFGLQLAGDETTAKLYAFANGEWHDTGHTAQKNVWYDIALVLNINEHNGKVYLSGSNIYSADEIPGTPHQVALSGHGEIELEGATAALAVSIVVEADGKSVKIDESGNVTVLAGSTVVISGGDLAGEVHVVVPDDNDPTKSFDITRFVTGIAQTGTFTPQLDESNQELTPAIGALDLNDEESEFEQGAISVSNPVPGLYYVLESTDQLQDFGGANQNDSHINNDDVKQARSNDTLKLVPNKSGVIRFYRVKVQPTKPENVALP